MSDLTQAQIDAHHRMRRARKGLQCTADELCPRTGSNTIIWHPSQGAIVEIGTTNVDHVCGEHRALFDGIYGRTVIRLTPRCLERSICTNPATHATTYVFVHGDDKRPKTINACDDHGDKYRNRPRTFTVKSDRELYVYTPAEWAHEFEESTPDTTPATTALTFVSPE